VKKRREEGDVVRNLQPRVGIDAVPSAPTSHRFNHSVVLRERLEYRGKKRKRKATRLAGSAPNE